MNGIVSKVKVLHLITNVKLLPFLFFFNLVYDKHKGQGNKFKIDLDSQFKFKKSKSQCSKVTSTRAKGHMSRVSPNESKVTVQW